MSPTTLAYGGACAMFAALTAVSLIRWRRGLSGLWLNPALFGTSAWTGMLAAASSGYDPGDVAVFCASVIQSGLWLAVLARIVPRSADPWLRHARWAAFLVPFAVLAAGAASLVLRDLGILAPSRPLPLVEGGLVLALLGVVLLEQAFRNATPGDRWALKYVLLGVGVLFVIDLVLYANALAFGAADARLWEARGAVDMLAAVVLWIGLSRLSRHRPAVQASQGVIFYTATLIAVGLYLVVMAFAALYVRVAGGTWGALLQALFVTSALLMLAVLLFSEQVRAWTTVVLAKTFAPYRYDYRAEWLRLTEALSGADQPGPLADRALRAVTRIVHSTSGGLWMRDPDGRYSPVAGELSTAPGHVVGAAEPWLRFLGEREWILDLSTALPPDIRRDDLPAWLAANTKAWLVIPLLRGEVLEGFIVAGQPLAPTAALTWEDLDLLKATGRQAAAFLALERYARQLMQAQQFDAYNRLAAFMMHDLKNVAAQLALVVQNAAEHRRNPDFVDDAIATVDNAARRMLRLLEQFRAGADSARARRVNVVATCRQVIERCAKTRPSPTLVAPDEVLNVTIDPDRMAHVVEHVVRNAQEATPAAGRVTVTVKREGASVLIEVADTGCGMEPDFVRDELFRPFYSTKGSQSMGIGAYQAREFVRESGGRVDVDSAIGRGTTFRIELPAASVQEARGAAGGARG